MLSLAGRNWEKRTVTMSSEQLIQEHIDLVPYPLRIGFHVDVLHDGAVDVLGLVVAEAR